MRLLPVITALALVTATAFAQEIAIASRLRTGDEFQLQITRTRQNSARPQQNAKGTTIVDVRVLSAAAAGITLDWVPGETTYDNIAVAQDPLMSAASAALKGLRLRITLSGEGEFVALANEDEVRPKLQAAIDIIVNDLIAKTPENQRQGFRAFISQILSPTTAISSVTSDAQAYFGLHGVTIAGGESIEVDLNQPNPLGGTIATRLRIHAESVTKDSASLSTRTTYDPTALREMTRSLAAKAGQPIPQEQLDKLPSMEMADDGKFLFDRTLGLMREVVVNRRIAMGPAQQRLDGWDIRLLKSPAR